MSSDETVVYPCPKCGAPAEMIEGKDTVIRCGACGDTRIVLSLSVNGDIQTTVEGTGESYELDPAVRRAQKALESVPSGHVIATADARNALAAAYADSGREGIGEDLAKMSLTDLRSAVSRYVSRYCEQVSLCAFYAQARGGNADAVRMYDDALAILGCMDDPSVAMLKIKRGLLWTRSTVDSSRKHLEEALAILERTGTEGLSDDYVRVAAYSALRTIAQQSGDREAASDYLDKELEERLDLLDADTTDARMSELADAMGRKAEELANTGKKDEALKVLNDAAEVTADRPMANAYAAMNLARFQQSTGSVPDDFGERMDRVIDALAGAPEEKRTMETLAQAHMFRSMARDAEDYDGLVADIGASYRILMDLAYKGEVNEMFLMSAARSYLVLLNMKDSEKAKEVRSELAEIGISQMDLDRSSRSSMGNAGKSTRVDIAPRPEKPLPGRRLKRNVKKSSKE